MLFMELAIAIALLAPRIVLVAFALVALIASPRTHPWTQYLRISGQLHRARAHGPSEGTAQRRQIVTRKAVELERTFRNDSAEGDCVVPTHLLQRHALGELEFLVRQLDDLGYEHALKVRQGHLVKQNRVLGLVESRRFVCLEATATAQALRTNEYPLIRRVVVIANLPAVRREHASQTPRQRGRR